ncbi:MAG: metallophosphoesterase [Planctomycetes bacterium]|nr:metallophosphoesterase [Planctomycetota bacterium]
MPTSPSRRDFLKTTSTLALLGAGAGTSVAAAETAPLPALLPRDSQGRHFVFYADCCSGIAGTGNEQNHAAVNRVVARLQPGPEFIAFPGDAVMGYLTDPAPLRQQWDYWWNTEMAWLHPRGIPLYQSTSNHNTYDLASEEVFRQVHPHLPQNGPEGQRGLAYAVRNGNLLYVSTHQPDRTRPDRSTLVMETAWLDQILTQHADARYKFVCGHYPVFPVNGYFQSPQWCFRPAEREPFWEVLVKHQVHAYLCSHILAFDVQIHRGIPQILSGGAGTQGAGPLALMPARSEYLHCVEMAVDDQGLRCQTRGVDGRVRETLTWPCPFPASPAWQRLTPTDCTAQLSSLKPAGKIVAFRASTGPVRVDPAGTPQTLLWGWDSMEGLATVWIGWEGTPLRLTVRLIPQSGFGWQVWSGPVVPLGVPWTGEVALHPGLGPGGVLWRPTANAPWQSLSTTSSKGLEDLTWPRYWNIGHGHSGADEWPCLAPALEIDWTHADLPSHA